MPEPGPGRPSSGERFTPGDRLHHKREFDRIHAAGVRVTGRCFTIIGLPNEVGRSRLGVALGRKVGNAVQRNKARRRLREIFRRRRAALARHIDLVVVGRPGIAAAPLAVLEKEFLERCTQLARLMKGRC